jgi:hypothetical protein
MHIDMHKLNYRLYLIPRGQTLNQPLSSAYTDYQDKMAQIKVEARSIRWTPDRSFAYALGYLDFPKKAEKFQANFKEGDRLGK